MKKGNVYVVFEDAIDVALMFSEATDEALEQMAQDADDDIGVSNDFEDAEDSVEFDDGDEPFFKDDEGQNLCSGEYADDDIPIYSMSPADMEAGEYLNVYYNMTNGTEMGVGEMIDFIAGS